MASVADPTHDNVEDDQFEKHFAKFAASKDAPGSGEDIDEGQPEGNDPEEVEEGADEAPETAPEEDTSDDTAGAEEAPADQAPDPWASVPPELREQFEQLRREKEAAEHRARSDAARVAALSRKLASQTVSADQAPAKQEDTEAQKALDAKRKQLEEDYPDVAAPLFEVIDGLKSELGAVQQQVGAVTAERQEQVIAARQAELEAVHPDWRDIAANPAFADWANQQPPKIQELVQSWDARETSVALSLFKTEMGMAASQNQGARPEPGPEVKANAATGARRSAQLEGGRDVRSRPAPAASGASDDFEAAFAHYQAKQDAKRLAGRR